MSLTSLQGLSVGNVALSVGALILYLQSTDKHTVGTISSLSAAAVASLGVPILSVFEHLRSFRPSDILQTYLLAVALENAYEISKASCLVETSGTIALWAVKTTVVAVLLILECLHKASAVIDPIEKVSTDDFDGVFDRRLFLWLLPLFRRGAFIQLAD